MASGKMGGLRGLSAMATAVLLCASAAVPGVSWAQSTTQKEGPVIREATIEETDLSAGGGNSDAANRRDRQTMGSKKNRLRVEDIPDERIEGRTPAVLPAEGEEKGGLPLLAKITDKSTPQRAASLKLIDEGRKSLAAGEYRQALGAFERAIAVDSTNPYSHYFVARAHFFLGNHHESFNFLDVAESLLGWHKRWLAEIHVLRGRNAAAMGFLGRADSNYLEALDLNPYNRFALEKLTTIGATMAQATERP